MQDTLYKEINNKEIFKEKIAVIKPVCGKLLLTSFYLFNSQEVCYEKRPFICG
jgi:hypothetical protein